MPNSTSKQCTKCKQIFPATTDFFPKDNRHFDGLQSHCRICFQNNTREWRKEHIEKARETVRQWNKTHRKKKSIDGARWNSEHPESRKIIAKRYNEKHPDTSNIIQQRRRARKLALPATLTDIEWQEIKAAWGYSCAYCGRKWFEIESVLHQEHVIPVAQGGAYSKDNIVPACRKCNFKKNNRTPEQAGMKLRDKII